MEDKDIFYKKSMLIEREPRLVSRKKSEKVFSDPFILTCIVIQIIMILIVLALHFS